MKVTYEVHQRRRRLAGRHRARTREARSPPRPRPRAHTFDPARVARGISQGPVNAQATIVIAPTTASVGRAASCRTSSTLRCPSQARITDAITMIESTTGGVTFVPRTARTDYVKFVTKRRLLIARSAGRAASRCSSSGTTAVRWIHRARADARARHGFTSSRGAIAMTTSRSCSTTSSDGHGSNFDKECDRRDRPRRQLRFRVDDALPARCVSGPRTASRRSGCGQASPTTGRLANATALSVLDRFTIGYLYGLNNIPPVPRIGPLAASYDEGSEVPFDATGSTDADDKVLTYSWNFGDDTCFGFPEPADCTQAQPKHRYPTDGVYKVGSSCSIATSSRRRRPSSRSGTWPRPSYSTAALEACNEGSAGASQGQLHGPGTDPWSATVDYGDGGGPQTLALRTSQFSLQPHLRRRRCVSTSRSR